MKNFKKVLSKTVASVYTAHTYGFAIRKPLRKVYQTTGMLRIPEHHVNRGIGLRGHALPFAKRVEDRRDSGRHKGA